MKDQVKLGLTTLLATLLPVFDAGATHALGTNPWADGFSVDVEGGYSTVNAMELVYDDTVAPDYLLSELDWEADLVLGGLSSSLRFSGFLVNAGVWSSLDTLDGSMVDRDWLYTDTPAWSDQSIGEADLDLTLVDVNAGYTIVKTDGAALDLVIGYRRSELEWADFGGTYIYSSYGFRDDVGSFDEETGITYDQTIELPYVGAHGHIRAGGMTLSVYALYSSIGDITAEDHHILRDLHFVDEFTDVEYLGLGAQAAWQVLGGLTLTAALDYEDIPEVRGDDTILEYGETYEDAAGTSLESTTFSLSLAYVF